MSNFADRLIEAIERCKSVVVVGLDPIPELLPPELIVDSVKENDAGALECMAAAVTRFNCSIIDAIADLVPAVKPQSAFYERLGPAGISTLLHTIEYAKSKGLIVILDAKRSDIATTAEAYAEAYLGEANLGDELGRVKVFGVDALTVSPYLGSDGVLPFLRVAEQYGRGVFVLARTSNPSSVELQHLSVTDDRAGSTPLAEFLAREIHRWGIESVSDSGYSALGAVVAATFSGEAHRFRELMPRAYFLVPGIGAQGADVSQVSAFFNADGLGALISASRSLIYAYRSAEWSGLAFGEATSRATEKLRDAVERARRRRIT